MGGDDELAWDLHPERDATLIRAQDMLLSRALNRGYAMSASPECAEPSRARR